MSLFLPLFTWADHTAIGMAIRASRWLFPVIEAFHPVALALLGGTVLIVDMRLPFQIKMVFLFLAIVYTFTIRRRLLRSNVDLAWPVRSRLAGGVSIALWSVVGFMGRGIGFW